MLYDSYNAGQVDAEEAAGEIRYGTIITLNLRITPKIDSDFRGYARGLLPISPLAARLRQLPP